MAACEWGHKKYKECDVQICMHGETNSTQITERFHTLGHVINHLGNIVLRRTAMIRTYARGSTEKSCKVSNLLYVVNNCITINVYTALVYVLNDGFRRLGNYMVFAPLFLAVI